MTYYAQTTKRKLAIASNLCSGFVVVHASISLCVHHLHFNYAVLGFSKYWTGGPNNALVIRFPGVWGVWGSVFSPLTSQGVGLFLGGEIVSELPGHTHRVFDHMEKY